MKKAPQIARLHSIIFIIHQILSKIYIYNKILKFKVMFLHAFLLKIKTIFVLMSYLFYNLKMIGGPLKNSLIVGITLFQKGIIVYMD